MAAQRRRGKWSRRRPSPTEAGASDRSTVVQRRYRPGDGFDDLLLQEIVVALFLGAVWKLVALLSIGEPYSAWGADAVAISSLVIWEVVARRRRVDRLVPPIWLIVVFGLFSMAGLSYGLGFHIGNGVLAAIVLIGVCGCLLVLSVARSSRG